MKILTLLDIKQALWDSRFRSLFPEYEKEIEEFIKNPGCACNRPLYEKLMKHKDTLKEYFPTKEIVESHEEPSHWKVINCSIHDLNKQLNKLSKNHKQIALARYEDQITVVIYEA